MIHTEFAPVLLMIVGLLSYVLGSIPFGLLIARVMGLGDLRKLGSGNIGATNVLRTGSKLGAFLTLLLDAGKAGIAVLIARYVTVSDPAEILAGVMAFIGHCYPVWLRFQGGKGIATFFGLLFALSLPLGLISGATWLLVARVTRYSSLAALVTAVTAPGYALLIGSKLLSGALLGLAVLIFLRHKDNIARLRQGRETQIGGGDSG